MAIDSMVPRFHRGGTILAAAAVPARNDAARALDFGSGTVERKCARTYQMGNIQIIFHRTFEVVATTEIPTSYPGHHIYGGCFWQSGTPSRTILTAVLSEHFRYLLLLNCSLQLQLNYHRVTL